MKEQMLIPFALRDKLPALYETEGQSDPICHIKLFGYNGELGHQRQKHLDTLVGDIFRI
jgi:hypothetical protein